MSKMIQAIGGQFLSFNHLIGGDLPNFNFVDLDGKEYNSKIMDGKWVVVKLWFIGCKPCIAEMPQLNELVEQYKNREDIVFLSLAWDSPEKLEQFLKKTRFDYAVVPNEKQYIMETLGIEAFPTHMIVKNGVIVEVVSNAVSLENSLDNVVEKL